MWGVAKPLLVILSVTLNSAFVAAWITQALPEKKCTKTSDCELFRKIGVSEAQLVQIKPRLEKFRDEASAQCQQINRLRRELIDLIAAEKPDRQLIAAKQKEILEGQRKMQEFVVEQLLTEKSVLTTEQLKAFFDLIRTRCGCGGTEKEMGFLELPEIQRGRQAGPVNDCVAETPPESS
ncbi:MAG TPA: periplasmic heavy metal sensor [Gemmataceae bacterium]|jgi:Spy/CpxP family protein refolding chaperone|nr:periplasmic heavy metal sensor [Gemmataceae bacterium]